MSHATSQSQARNHQPESKYLPAEKANYLRAGRMRRSGKKIKKFTPGRNECRLQLGGC